MTLALQLYNSGNIKTITNSILDTSLYEEFESYESNGTVDEYFTIYIDLSNFIKDMSKFDSVVYIEFLSYIYYLGEIPDDILDILSEFLSDLSIKNYIDLNSFDISISTIEQDIERFEKYISTYGNGLLFVGWYKINLLRKGPLVGVFLKQES